MELTDIPNVDETMAADLEANGYERIEDITGTNPTLLAETTSLSITEAQTTWMQAVSFLDTLTAFAEQHDAFGAAAGGDVDTRIQQKVTADMAEYLDNMGWEDAAERLSKKTSTPNTV